MKVFRKLKWALPLALVMVLVTTVVAFALTIVVDGVRESAWDDGVGSQTPGSQLDNNETGIDDSKDIREVLWTNDVSNMYFLIETWGYIDFDGDPQPAIYICLDMDGNSSTGSSYANCSNMTGIERTIRIRLDDVNTTPLRVRITNGAPTGSQISSRLDAAIHWHHSRD